jgi:hypothetical protein
MSEALDIKIDSAPILTPNAPEINVICAYRTKGQGLHSGNGFERFDVPAVANNDATIIARKRSFFMGVAVLFLSM